jgi:nickel/cobalt transporter (NicO) family protein
MVVDVAVRLVRFAMIRIAMPIQFSRISFIFAPLTGTINYLPSFMLQLFFGSFLLSLVHASIPNHWLPVVAISKAEKWTQHETMMVTVISGFAHTLSTVIIGITIGFIGHRLNENYTFISDKVAPALLILLGLVYLIIDRLNHHKHTHGFQSTGNKSRSKWAIIVSLAIAMFLSPCLEVEAYYFQAGIAGWQGIFLVSAVYIIVTVSGMLLLVYLGNKGVRAIRSHFLDHHEKLLSGFVLILLGFFALFVHF